MQISQKFRMLSLTAPLIFGLANSAFAECTGVDLRLSLNEAERSSLNETVADIPFNSGNHWRATRGDKVVHLIGTIHLDDPRLEGAVERLSGVIESSELLLLEVTPAEEAALKKDMQERPELMFLQNDTLPELLEERDWQDLASAMQERGIPPILTSRFQPWYLSVMLGMPPCLAQRMMSGTELGLDNRLRDIALNADVPLAALEPHDTLFTLFADEPLEEQIDVLLLGLETSDSSLDMLATIVAAYYEEHHAQAWEMSRLAVMDIESKPKAELRDLFGEMEADLLSARNIAWIPVILAALEDRQQITVAAGAGHWAGSQGVLALLEAEGFTLQRLPF